MHSKEVERRWILLESIPCHRIVSLRKMKIKILLLYLIDYFSSYYVIYIMKFVYIVWHNWYAVCIICVYNLVKEWIYVYMVMGASMWSSSARNSQIRCNNLSRLYKIHYFKRHLRWFIIAFRFKYHNIQPSNSYMWKEW